MKMTEAEPRPRAYSVPAAGTSWHRPGVPRRAARRGMGRLSYAPPGSSSALRASEPPAGAACSPDNRRSRRCQAPPALSRPIPRRSAGERGVALSPTPWFPAQRRRTTGWTEHPRSGGVRPVLGVPSMRRRIAVTRCARGVGQPHVSRVKNELFYS